jgi:hypothetical protein
LLSDCPDADGGQLVVGGEQPPVILADRFHRRQLLISIRDRRPRRTSLPGLER